MGVNTPGLLLVKPTEPVGAILVPGDVSVTVAIQVVACFTVTAFGLQLTVVVVERLVTVIVVLPELLKWSVSPP